MVEKTKVKRREEKRKEEEKGREEKRREEKEGSEEKRREGKKKKEVKRREEKNFRCSLSLSLFSSHQFIWHKFKNWHPKIENPGGAESSGIG